MLLLISYFFAESIYTTAFLKEKIIVLLIVKRACLALLRPNPEGFVYELEGKRRRRYGRT